MKRFPQIAVSLFLVVGCHNNTHLRKQRMLGPREKAGENYNTYSKKIGLT